MNLMEHSVNYFTIHTSILFVDIITYYNQKYILTSFICLYYCYIDQYIFDHLFDCIIIL